MKNIKIDHIIHNTGHTSARLTSSINKNTTKVFKSFQLNNQEKTLKIPKTDLDVLVTAYDDGAAFTFYKNKSPLSTNMCCFSEKQSHAILKSIEELIESLDFLPRHVMPQNVVIPQSAKYLYTILIPTPDICLSDIAIISEVEFYIYYSLYLAYKKRKKSMRSAS
jgi:hypothetical protein